MIGLLVDYLIISLLLYSTKHPQRSVDLLLNIHSVAIVLGLVVEYHYTYSVPHMGSIFDKANQAYIWRQVTVRLESKGLYQQVCANDYIWQHCTLVMCRIRCRLAWLGVRLGPANGVWTWLQWDGLLCQLSFGVWYLSSRRVCWCWQGQWAQAGWAEFSQQDKDGGYINGNTL